ncbi:precorrin-3B synthase [Albidovulum sp.]|uniref:precorrin-3B synthase n=1 Tax=Albidovulum sp. TaxID=1872424 RepID=UPI0039B92BE6
MSAPVIQGWCPGALRPMLSGDGLVVRVRPHLGRLTQVQAAGIADLAARHGNGLIDLSARANLQIRGVTESGHPPLIDGLRGLGLIDDSIASETRRNIVVQPFWSAGDATLAVGAALEGALAAGDAPATPAKFGYAVDCGAAPVLTETPADIRIERLDGVLIVRADGAATAARATEATAATLALDLARWFLGSGGAPAGRGRMAAHLARGAVLPEPFRTIAVPHPQQGQTPRPGATPPGLLAAFAFGQTDAETLSVLAGIGPIRLTPWRMLLIEGAVRVPDLAGLVTDPDSPLLRTTACTGAPGCPQALIATRDLARRLSARLRPAETLHVSGCAKGCAHPGPAHVTLVGQPGGKVAIIRDGTAGGAPRGTGLDPATLTITDLTETTHAPHL